MTKTLELERARTVARLEALDTDEDLARVRREATEANTTRAWGQYVKPEAAAAATKAFVEKRHEIEAERRRLQAELARIDDAILDAKMPPRPADPELDALLEQRRLLRREVRAVDADPVLARLGAKVATTAATEARGHDTGISAEERQRLSDDLDYRRAMTAARRAAAETALQANEAAIGHRSRDLYEDATRGHRERLAAVLATALEIADEAMLVRRSIAKDASPVQVHDRWAEFTSTRLRAALQAIWSVDSSS